MLQPLSKRWMSQSVHTKSQEPLTPVKGGWSAATPGKEATPCGKDGHGALSVRAVPTVHSHDPSQDAYRCLLKSIRASTGTTINDSAHALETLCASAAADADGHAGGRWNALVRCSSLGAFLVRRARLLRDKGALSTPLDELTLHISRAVGQLARMTHVNDPRVSSHDVNGCMQLLAAEVRLVEATTTQRVKTQIVKLSLPSLPQWDTNEIQRNVLELPSPVDFSRPAQYCEQVEMGRGSRHDVLHGDDALGLIVDVSLATVVSTRDPLSLRKMTVPVRGTDCVHLQCFELSSFIATAFRTSRSADIAATRGPQEKVAAAPCPVCTKMTLLTNLYVDKIQQKALLTCGDIAQLKIERRSGVISGVADSAADATADATCAGVEAAPPGSPGGLSSRKRTRDSLVVFVDGTV